MLNYSQAKGFRRSSISSGNAYEQVIRLLHLCDRWFLPVYFFCFHQEYFWLHSSHGLLRHRNLGGYGDGLLKTAAP